MRTIEWTDERMYDLAKRMDAGFARVDADIRDLRAEMQRGHASLRAEMQRVDESLRAEMQRGDDLLRTEIVALRSTMVRFGVAIMAAMAGMIATLIGVVLTSLV